jgi:hypothetical protein
VGLPCQSDSDCRPPGGPGVNICSSSLSDPIFPTPVCVLLTCDPYASLFCDAPPNQSSNTPGVCLQTGTNPDGGDPPGVCLPLCGIDGTGSAPEGCVGNDTCVNMGLAEFSTSRNAVWGPGYCWGGCTTDSECPTGSSCQTNEGICVRTVTPPTKALGAPCTSADNGSATTPAACNCVVDPWTSTMAGTCTQFCIVDSPAAACPAGYLCDSFETTDVFPIQSVGIAGSCLHACDGDAGTCPANLTCVTSDTAGPDCLP